MKPPLHSIPSHRTVLRWTTAWLAAALLGVPLAHAAEPPPKKNRNP